MRFPFGRILSVEFGYCCTSNQLTGAPFSGRYRKQREFIMKSFSYMLVFTSLLLFSGCISLDKSEVSTISTGEYKGKVILKGFTYTARIETGEVNSSYYVPNSSGGYTASGSSRIYNDVEMTDIRDYIQKTLEDQGFNMRSRNPTLVVEGDVTEIKLFPRVETELPLYFAGICTMGMAWSSRYEGKCSLRVYGKDGDLLKKYEVTPVYQHVAISIVPFLAFLYATDESEKRARNFGAAEAINAFLKDYKTGIFNDQFEVKESLPSNDSEFITKIFKPLNEVK